MGWYGTWNIEYKGKNPEKFVKLAKLIIPNYKERFINYEGDLHCTRALSWYSADNDISKILSYLDEGEEIHTVIAGETHPLVKKSEAEKAGLDYKYLLKEEYEDKNFYTGTKKNPLVALIEETQVFKKVKGEVKLENKFVDEDRYKHNWSGNYDDLSYCLKYDKLDYIKGALSFWANTFSEDNEMLEIASNYFSELLGKFSLDKDSETCNLLKDFKEAAAHPKSLQEFLKGYVNESEKQENQEKNYSNDTEKLLGLLKSNDVLKLGGKDVINDLVSAQGYKKAYNLLNSFGFIDKNKEFKEMLWDDEYDIF